MGIKGLSKIIKPFIKTGSLSQFNNTIIGIDTSLFMHKFCNIACKNCSDENVYPTVESYFKNYSKKFVNNNIEPLFIFDNKSHNLKLDTIETRKKNCKNTVVKKEYFTNIQQFFKVNKIKYEIAPESFEAEQHGAILNRNGVISAFVTADLDSLVFGCKNVITEIDKKNEIKYYESSCILKELELTHEKFLFMCLMMGSDFNQKGIKNYGPMKSLKFVKEHSLLEIYDLLAKELENFEEIYHLFIKTS